MGVFRHFLHLVLFIIPILASSQLNDLEFEYLLKDDILIQSIIVRMEESNDGRFWFGSKSGGLMGCDGYDFSYFRQDPSL
jgi:hypothetical protein